MKKLILTLAIFFNFCANAQSIVDICSGESLFDLPTGSYRKDINNELNKFNGTWIWTNGSDVVTFKLQKVINQYFTEYDAYGDYMIGNYKYTKNNGSIEVVNTILTPSKFNFAGNLLPEFHPMYAICPENETTINFTFEDINLNKRYCEAIFEFLPGSTTQMKLTQKNRGTHGVEVNEGDPIPVFNPDFTIPNEIVLTKQP